jgi:hypothetical protein
MSNIKHWLFLKNETEAGKVTAREQLFGGGGGSPQLSPVYLSEAARQIVEEVAWRGRGGRRLIPKEKRRHHTVSGQPVLRNHTPYSPVNIFTQIINYLILPLLEKFFTNYYLIIF